MDYNEPKLEFIENNTVIRMIVFISNSALLKPRTANRLKQTCDQLECLLVDEDDPVFANCNIMLERKQ